MSAKRVYITERAKRGRPRLDPTSETTAITLRLGGSHLLELESLISEGSSGTNYSAALRSLVERSAATRPPRKSSLVVHVEEEHVTVYGLLPHSNGSLASAQEREILRRIPKGMDVNWSGETHLERGGWRWPLVSRS